MYTVYSPLYSHGNEILIGEIKKKLRKLNLYVSVLYSIFLRIMFSNTKAGYKAANFFETEGKLILKSLDSLF